MQAFDIGRMADEARRTAAGYHEFLSVPALSAGIYALPKGGVDRQTPHGEDEIYYVLSGRARIRVGGEDRELGPGALVFVPAGVEHRFHEIGEDLVLLVAFGPAEGSRRPAGS